MLIESDTHKALSTISSTSSFVNDFESNIGFSRAPFTSLPKNNYLFQSESALQVVNTVIFSLKAGESIVKITGEKGVGKTFLLRQSISVLSDEYYVMHCIDSSANAIDFLKSIIEEFGFTYSISATVPQLLKQIQCLLYEHYSKTDYPIVVWIDDAQNIPLDTLGVIESLCEFQTKQRKLIRFILSGTSELDRNLEKEIVKQLRHNIAHYETLKPLTQNEIWEYVNLRLKNSGVAGDIHFTPAAMRLLYRKSKGIPRAINYIANKALLLAYGKGELVVTKSYVYQAAIECDWLENKYDRFLIYFFYLPMILAGLGIGLMLGIEWIAP